jgi:hypothetical protein
MSLDPKLRLPVLAAALATTIASAWATHGNSTLVPAPWTPMAQHTPIEETTDSEPVVVANEEGLAVNEQVVTEVPAQAAIAPKQPLAPVVDATPPREPAITVETQRLTLDERIQADVMDLLARNPNLSGRIGVVSEDAVVTLTGYTTTSGMAWRAARDARGVTGVRQVVNEIRPRVGGITS